MSDEAPDEKRPRLVINPQILAAMQQAQIDEELLIIGGIEVEPSTAPSDAAIRAGGLAKRMATQRAGDGGIIYTTDEDAPARARLDQIRRDMETELRHYLDKQYTEAAYAVEINDLRQRLAESDAERDRLARKDLYDRVIERFNRSHSHRKKTTLREICDQMGVSYEAVRKYRLRAGKRKG